MCGLQTCRLHGRSGALCLYKLYMTFAVDGLLSLGGATAAPPRVTRMSPLRQTTGPRGGLLCPDPGPAALVSLCVLWAVSRRARNRHMHALHGNGPPKKGGPTSAPPGGGRWHTNRPPRLQPRQLQELQTAGTLRADGWALPATVGSTQPVRVYDTRLAPGWLRAVAPDLRSPGDPENLVIVGGDFLSSPDVLDAEALQQERLQRWGPSGPCHIFIPPRPHLQSWVDRLLLQVEVDSQSLFSLCRVVPRDGCPAQLDAEATHQLVPAGC